MLDGSVSQPGDLALQRPRTPFATLEEGVYVPLMGREQSDSEIKRPTSELKYGYPPLVGAVTSLTGDHAFLENHKLTSGILRNLAERTEEIAIRACDGKGYLIWQRQSPLPE